MFQPRFRLVMRDYKDQELACAVKICVYFFPLKHLQFSKQQHPYTVIHIYNNLYI